MTVSSLATCKLVSHFDVRLVSTHPLKVKEPSQPTLRRSSFQERGKRETTRTHLLSQQRRRGIIGEWRRERKGALQPRD